MRLPEIPEYARDSVLRWFGAEGRLWLEDLPEVVERLLDEWDLRPAGQAFDGGTHSYVLPVERGGEDAVLKVICRDDENAAEPTALRDYDGDGAVRLYEYDAETGAMLLERALPGTQMVTFDSDPRADREVWLRRLETACCLHRRLWRPPGPPEGFPAYPSATEALEGWRAAFDRLEPQWRERADDLLRALAEPGEIGIANRDTHMGNIVAAAREPWLLIDPKPYLAERAFDAGFIVFRHLEGGIPMDAAEMVRRTAGHLGVDYERARAWAELRALVDVADADPGAYRDTCLSVATALHRA